MAATPRDTPLVSVVVPSLDSGRYVEAALRSALGQEWADLEVVVQDGGSTDGTLATIAALADPRVTVVSEPDGGQADALNRALGRARGEWIVWLNADDLLAPGALAAVAPHLHGPHDVLYGDFDLVGPDGAPLRHYEAFPRLSRSRLLTRGLYVFSGSTFVRRRVFERLGPYDTSLRFCMDYDFALRIAPHVEARHLERTLGRFREQPESKTSRQALGFWRESVGVRRRHGGFSGALLAPTALRQAADGLYFMSRPLWRSAAFRRLETARRR